MKKRYLKQFSSLVLGAALVATSVLPSMAAEPEQDTTATVWTLGYGDKNQNAPTAGEQGSNGWHFMYTEETNKNGSFDTDKIADCTYYGTEGHQNGLYGSSSWLPTADALKSYNDEGNNWWYLNASDDNGELSPNVLDMSGAPYSAVIAWEAPEDGTYNITVDYFHVGGRPAFFEANPDFEGEGGVTLSLNTEDECLDKINAPAVDEPEKLASGTFEEEVTLKKGEKVYLIADPETEGDQDIAKAKIKVEKKEVVSSVWTLGLKENTNGPKDGKQGENGWYFLYSDDIDVAEGTVFSNIKECTWSDKGSMQLKSEGGSYDSMWVPDNYLKDGLTGDALKQPSGSNEDATFNNWVMTSNGTLNTNVETTAVTGIYAWEAPEDGSYDYEMNFEAGGDHCVLGGTTYYYYKDYYIKDGTKYQSTPKQREGGVAVSVNTKDSQEKYGQYIAKTEDHDYLYSDTFTGTVELKKGERIYFAVDPREVGSYDMANLAITITTHGACEWGEASYSWDEDNVCTATRNCATHPGHKSTVTVEGVLQENEAYTAPTCTEAGEGVFVAEFSEPYETQTATRPIKKLGHDFSNAWDDYWNVEDHANSKIIFAEDGSKCTWETKCKNCDEFGVVEETDNVTITTDPNEEGAASCTEPGTFYYEASFYWGWLPVKSEQMTTDQPLGHDYSDIYNAEYEWTSDKTTCVKTYLCSRCDEPKTETTAVAAEITEPTCTEDGKAVASFDWGWDVQTEKLPALGHVWSDWKKVSGATTSKPEIQERTCSRCNESETREVGSVLPTKVTKLAVNGISKKIAAGKSVQLTATVSPSNATNKGVTWKSSNTKYATVNSKGKVVTKAAGKGKTVTITATAKDGSKVKETYKISIMKNAVKSISLKAKASTVKAGKSTTVKATVKTTGKSSVNKTLKWSSSNTKYATVNSKGKVVTKAAGKGKTVTITAKATDGTGKSKKIKIKIK